MSLDPLSNKFPYQSPYVFASNTPIQAVDADGKATLVVSGSAGYFFLLFGHQVNTGIAFSTTGQVGWVSSVVGKVGLGGSAGAGGTVSFFPTMDDISNLSGEGFGVEASGGLLGKGGVSIDKSSDKWWISGSLMAGGGAHVAWYGGKAVVKATTWTAINKYLSQDPALKATIQDKLKDQKSILVSKINANNKLIMKNEIIKGFNNSSSEERNDKREEVVKALDENKKLDGENKENTKQVGQIDNALNQIK